MNLPRREIGQIWEWYSADGNQAVEVYKIVSRTESALHTWELEVIKDENGYSEVGDIFTYEDKWIDQDGPEQWRLVPEKEPEQVEEPESRETLEI